MTTQIVAAFLLWAALGLVGAIVGGLAEFERELIRARTGSGLGPRVLLNGPSNIPNRVHGPTGGATKRNPAHADAVGQGSQRPQHIHMQPGPAVLVASSSVRSITCPGLWTPRAGTQYFLASANAWL
jgi:hypothetical protein